jgi:hypothetical protein
VRWYGDGVVVMVSSSCSGGGGHTVNLVTGEPPSGSLAPDLGARVPVGLPCALTWIRVMCIGASLDGESSTGKILMGSSLSSSSSAFPSPPSPCPSDENLKRLDAG